ncbi:hypothetical protein [Streptomyces sp. NPDC050263]|uniref:hypothetical protein n=1 Tax=Streptomyces sp. NPDC050263 TaxID=3155037 RepID=UPI00344474AC
MRTVLSIAAKDLRQRLRDRSAWVIVFLAPVLIAGLMALAFSSNAGLPRALMNTNSTSIVGVL